jgi:hypothetical protein
MVLNTDPQFIAEGFLPFLLHTAHRKVQTVQCEWAPRLTLYPAARGGEVLRRCHVAEPPPCHRKRLAKPVDGQGPLEHPREARKADVDCRLVNDVLVDLVGQHLKRKGLEFWEA